MPQKREREIQVSVQSPAQGTASWWVDLETGKILNEIGKPTQQGSYDFNEVFRKLMAGKSVDVQTSYCTSEQIGLIKEKFKPPMHADVIRTVGMYNREEPYKNIAIKVGKSESTIKNWLGKLGLTEKRKKKK